MGRLESLTSWALGRGPYEDTVVEGTGVHVPGGQQYNERGRPINPETKRRERENVRAANEVMQVTGVVEDSAAAKAEAKAYRVAKNEETFTGLRLMEVGRAALVGGVWGVLGLRRRILIYKPYAEMSLLGILKQESAVRSFPNLLYAGLPAVVAYHVSDWVGFISDALIDEIFDEEDKYTPAQLFLKHSTQTILDASFFYITLHFRMFAILQQLHIMPSSRLFPSFTSFIPFTKASPLQLPPTPSLNPTSLASWAGSLLATAAPILIILVHGKAKYFISRLLYRPIYKCLPRPTGDSMFSGIPEAAPSVEYDAPDRINEAGNIEVAPGVSVRAEDPQTLRALEGRPAAEDQEAPTRRERRETVFEMEQDSSDEEDAEMAHATLISFDVEATESMENSLGGWSAELRSANEPKLSKDVKYRVTGLTLLPTILATEGLREVIAGVLVMPLEAVMVRTIARAYRLSAGSSVSDLYRLRDPVPAFENLFSAFTLQLAITGVVWAGFTVGSQWWAGKKYSKVDSKENMDREEK